MNAAILINGDRGVYIVKKLSYTTIPFIFLIYFAQFIFSKILLFIFTILIISFYIFYAYNYIKKNLLSIKLVQ